ncbi:hypothetical protein COL940_007881 [Colletotrichum noveboracense]|nr:hypothetical protein COL940_007881 [Colletotrichum noveboracense]
MESYLRHELSREVRRQLHQKSLQLPQPFENQVIEIIESAQADAFQSYRQQDIQPMETHDPDVDYQISNSAQQPQIPYECGDEADPSLLAMTEGAHSGRSTAAAAMNLEPSQQALDLRCDFDSSLGSYDAKRQQDDDAGWMDNQDLDVSFIDWNCAHET